MTPLQPEQSDTPTCPYCGSHEVRATEGILSVTGPILLAHCACGKKYRLDDRRRREAKIHGKRINGQDSCPGCQRNEEQRREGT